jgi:hypothetical protein
MSQKLLVIDDDAGIGTVIGLAAKQLGHESKPFRTPAPPPNSSSTTAPISSSST